MYKEIVKNLINLFKGKNSVFDKNVKRWTKLPAGTERYRLEDILSKPDKECLATYLIWTKFWKKEKDWVVTLQVEGSSAVHAAVDIIFQKNIQSGNYSKYIAVGESSYHGPSSTSFGNGGGSHFVNIKQVTYPVPQIKYKRKDESWSNFLDRIEKNLYKFLEENYNEIKIVLIEPQWGSAGEGQFWPVDLLRKFVNMARQYGIYVISDEIMCGLGRHGRGKTFLVDSKKSKFKF